MVEILALWSPHKLLTNLGAFSEYAKCSQSSTKVNKNEILTLYPGYDGMVKKTIYATVPSIYKYSAQLAIINDKYQNLMYGYRMLCGTYLLVPLVEAGAVPTYPPLWPPEARRQRRLVCVA
jgi:hypothetical protein